MTTIADPQIIDYPNDLPISEIPTCSHCGGTTDLAPLSGHVGGRGTETRLLCRDRVRCAGRRLLRDALHGSIGTALAAHRLSGMAASAADADTAGMLGFWSRWLSQITEEAA